MRVGSEISAPGILQSAVQADVFYSANIRRARSDLVDPNKTFMPLEQVSVGITDARPMIAQLRLEKGGFILLSHTSKFVTGGGMAPMERPYHEEVGEVIREISGADLVLPHREYMQVRQPAIGDKDVDWFKAPSLLVHADFTHQIFLKLAENVQRAEGVAPTRFQRVALYQCWRPLSEPPHDFPLALTDALSVKRDDYIVMDNILGPEDVEGNVLEDAARPSQCRTSLVLFLQNDA